MKLSDVMSAAGLSIYAEVGLVLFMLVFIAVAIRVLSPSRSRQYELAGLIPLADEPVEERPLSGGLHSPSTSQKNTEISR